MSTDADGWIRMEDRMPTDADKPFWIYRPNMPHAFIVTLLEGSATPSNWEAVTHWQPATLPAPPKAEPTQRELDHNSYMAWINRPALDYTSDTESAWHAALAYRDAQNRTDIQAIHVSPELSANNPADFPFMRLRKRCGLD